MAAPTVVGGRHGAAAPPDDVVVMGRIAAPYGVKGWLKVLPATEEHEALLDYPEWWLRKRGDRSAWERGELVEGRTHANALIVSIAGIGDREAAAAFSGGQVGVPRAALPVAKGDEIYVADLVGLAVFNRQGESLGRVVEVQEFGAHPVLRIVGEDEAHLVPFVPAYVDAVDVEGGRIEVDWRKDY